MKYRFLIAAALLLLCLCFFVSCEKDADTNTPAVTTGGNEDGEDSGVTDIVFDAESLAKYKIFVKRA